MSALHFVKSRGLKYFLFCRHSPEMVKKLEQAGLGYYVKADETKEKLGNWELSYN